MPVKMTREEIYAMMKDLVNEAVGEKVQAAFEKANKRIADERQGLIDEGTGMPATASAKDVAINRAGQLVRAIVAGKGDKDKALAFVKNLRGGGDADVIKALEESTFTAGGALVQPDMAEEIIPLLSARTIVRKMGIEEVPLENGTMEMPFVGAGAVATWTGENVAQNATNMEFGQLVLKSRELIALVPVSNRLLRHKSGLGDRVVGNDLGRAISVAENAAFIRGPGSEAAPKGMLYWAVASNKFDATGTTVPTVVDNLGNAIFLLEDNDVDITNGGWMMNPIVKKGLFTALDANANPVWQAEMKDGTLYGFPFDYTTAIPRNLGSGDKSEVYFADFDTLVIGQDENLTIEALDQAAYLDATGTLQSAVSKNQTVIRAVMSVDFGARQRGKEISVIEEVDWDAITAS